MYIAYQPIVDLSSGDTLGYEALARFERGASPDQVFKQAWYDGKGVELETQAAKLALQNFRPKEDDVYLAINASAKTIIATRGELIKDDDEIEVPWSRLSIEISEKSAVDDYLPLDRPLRFLRERKARLAIDDVGTGTSGLWHMLQISPHILKVDRALIEHIDDSPIRRTMVNALVGIARDIRSTVVAEGIEREAEREWCVELGVDCGQGYLFGQPKPFPDR